jgi:hypothetical protein
MSVLRPLNRLLRRFTFFQTIFLIYKIINKINPDNLFTKTIFSKPPHFKAFSLVK